MNDTIKFYDEKMQKTINSLINEYGTIRAGRAHPAVLDRVTVDYYGTPTPIQQMAAVSVPEARILLIQPWDKSTLKEIEKAILASELGLNPSNDGEVIRLSFPQPTAERRKELCKNIAKLAEDAKVAIRSIRRDANDKLKASKKDNAITEDELKGLEKDVQNLTDKYCAEIDKICVAKEKEVMEI